MAKARKDLTELDTRRTDGSAVEQVNLDMLFTFVMKSFPSLAAEKVEGDMEHFREKWQAFVKSDTVSPPADQSTAKAEVQQGTEVPVHEESLGWVENVLNGSADGVDRKA